MTSLDIAFIPTKKLVDPKYKVDEAKAKLAPEIAKKKAEYKKTKVKEWIGKGMSRPAALNKFDKLREDKKISCHDPITLSDGNISFPMDLIFKKIKFTYMADIIEPEKGNTKAKFELNNIFDATIYSFRRETIHTLTFTADDVFEIIESIDFKVIPLDIKKVITSLNNILASSEMSQEDILKIMEQMEVKEYMTTSERIFNLKIIFNMIVEKKALLIMKDYGLLLSGRNVYIVDTTETELTLLNVHDLKTYYRNMKISGYDPEKNEFKSYNPVDVWIESKARKSFKGIEFNPNLESKSIKYNLFKGFKFQPKQIIDIGPFFEFIFNVICSGDTLMYGIVFSFFAQKIQNPNVKKGTALVMLSEKGTGKSTLMYAMMKLFEGYSFQTADNKRLFGSFNEHLANKLLIYANESLFIGNHAEGGKVKNLITETNFTYELKGGATFPSNNYSSLVIDSNDDSVIKETADERRFIYPKISSNRIGDTKYFDALYKLFDTQGFYESLMYALSMFDYSPWEEYLRKPPKNEVSEEQQLQSLSTLESWWYTCLEGRKITNVFYDLMDNGSIRISNSELFKSYSLYCKSNHIKSYDNPMGFGKLVKKHLVSSDILVNENAKDSKGNNAKIFASLDDCRNYFIKKQKLTSIKFESDNWTKETIFN